MSLLLDALKKAANDKEKSSRAESAEIPEPNPEAITAANPQAERADLKQINNQKEARYQKVPEQSFAEDASDTEILTLDIPQETQDVDDEISLDDGGSLTEPVKISAAPDVDIAVQNVNASVVENSSNSGNNDRSATSKLTVSDDALSLLIDKTNHDEKKKKLVVTVSVFLISLLILFSGGLYYYTDMQDEIAAIERKHKIAMQQMRAKTNREKIPEDSAIIRNLVSDAKLEEKVEYAKAQIASEKKSTTVTPSRQSKVSNTVARADLTITKTRKSDPVGENLNAAWLAYGNGSYTEAKQLYNNVLKIEDVNRDAQLGLAAIAVHEKDIIRARRIYLSLLQQDPRDPIATAGLAGINSDKASLKSDNDYLLSLLEKNPDAPHLNFSVGNNYAQQKKWKSAQQYYFKAWQHDSENADYLFNLAVSMDQLGKPDQAIVFYRDCLKKSLDKQVNFSTAAVQKRINELSGL